jgi:hypothetical protein
VITKVERNEMIKLLTGGVAALAVTAFTTAIPTAHADTDCGYARTSVRVEALGPTSCAFALNVANAMMNGAGNPMNVYSPTTGETYSMFCRIESHGSTTCRGGDGAGVQIF